MRLLSILSLLVVLAMPDVTRAQAGAPQTPAAPPSAGAGSAAAPTKSSAPATSTPSTPAAAPVVSEPSAAAPLASAPDSPAEVPSEGQAPAENAEPAPEASGAAGTALAPNALAPTEATIPSPGELGDRLVGDLPPQTEKPAWTAPTPVLTLHGYMRVRGELMDSFWLGRGPNEQVFNRDSPQTAFSANITRGGLGPDPFSQFRPLERAQPTSMCATAGVTTDDVGNVCKIDTLQFATMRFRFSPQLNISEDIRIKSTFDILDNYLLGRGPVSFYGAGRTADGALPGTNVPTGNLIVPRRVWAEVRNRDLGELRFGIMPEHWGLGMLYNAGNGLDDDYSTDLGRVMGTTKLAGFYISGAYDFMSETLLGKRNGEYRPDVDGSQLDDLDQYTLSVVRHFPDEDEQTVLARGDVVLNGGAHFQLRHQNSVLKYATGAMSTKDPELQSLNATFYTPDVWGQLRYGKLRLEVEAAWVVGKMRNLNNDKHQHVSEVGASLESELRLLNDKLGIYIYTGAASGDSDVEGLSSDANYIDGADPSRNNSLVSTFRFHPSYRVDMILWRNIMRQVTGAYYVKPGVSYDFLRDNFGQLFGARLDLIYSRALASVQTWGNDPNLGVELNAQLYWRSGDGPGINDGYHASLQYGVLFPLRGLGYYYKDTKLDTAQTVRLLLGVVF